ncbi:MAG TPA: TMEM165/GDT1 family protein [candidate division Zixibacteria bacterium]|nr:TMEM165/GDT1 family protein [candidate division Zixibacteria bacterium]
MDWKILFASFTTIFLAELGDKTQLAALFYASKCQKPWAVFIGASLALIASTILAVSLGHFAGKAIPTAIISKIAGGVFVVMGVLLFIGKI